MIFAEIFWKYKNKYYFCIIKDTLCRKSNEKDI